MFCYALLVSTFFSKIVFLPLHSVVGMFSCHLPDLLVNVFSLFWNVLFCLYCFILSRYLFNLLLSLVLSGLFPRVVLSFLLVLFFPFFLKMFQRFSSVFSFLLVDVDFLSAFPVEFPIQILSFCSCFLGKPRFFIN